MADSEDGLNIIEKMMSLTGSGNRFNFEREEPNQMIGFNSVASILYISHIKDIFATTKRYLVGYPWNTGDIHLRLPGQ